MLPSTPQNLPQKTNNPLDFSQSFGIMCITIRKGRKNDRPEAILSSKINIAQMQDLLSLQSPENRERKIHLRHYSKSVLDKREKDRNA